MTAISSATSGMMAAVTRLNASAQNTANSRSTGALPGTGKTTAYQPVDVVQVSEAAGGVTTSVQARTPGYQPAYEPYSPSANAQGMVAEPNVDEVGEAVGQIDALNQFKANLATVRTADDLLKVLIDLKS